MHRTHDYQSLANVYESPCVVSPCNAADVSGSPNAVFLAYPYNTQLQLWGPFTGAIFRDNAQGKFLANWFNCKNCGGDTRPDKAPPVWIYDDATKNAKNGVVYDSSTNTYRFESPCVEGYNCNTCGRAPLRRTFGFLPPNLIQTSRLLPAQRQHLPLIVDVFDQISALGRLSVYVHYVLREGK